MWFTHELLKSADGLLRDFLRLCRTGGHVILDLLSHVSFARCLRRDRACTDRQMLSCGLTPPVESVRALQTDSLIQ